MAWSLYKEIEYDTAGIPDANLTDFPKLITITTDADIAAELSGGGGIKFTSADGMTELAFGLYPSTNLAAGTVVARVKIPSLLTAASVGDVMCRIYYSGSDSTTEDKAGTVSSSYVIFMPLEEDPSGSPPQMYDWVSEANVGTSAGSMTSGDLVAGTVGNGLDFDGSNDAISLDSGLVSALNFGSGDSFTFSAWVYLPSVTSGRTLFMVGNYFQQGWLIGVDQFFGTGIDLQGNGFGSTANMSYANTNLSATTWTKVTFTYSNGTKALFYDATSIGLTGSFTPNGAATSEAYIGRAPDFTRTNWTGVIDEVSVASTARSADWITYSHADDFTNTDTFTLSAEQGGGGGITHDNYYPMLLAAI